MPPAAGAEEFAFLDRLLRQLQAAQDGSFQLRLFCTKGDPASSSHVPPALHAAAAAAPRAGSCQQLDQQLVKQQHEQQQQEEDCFLRAQMRSEDWTGEGSVAADGRDSLVHGGEGLQAGLQVTFGRLQDADLVSAVQLLREEQGGLQTDLEVFVCGPPGMMEDVMGSLINCSLGIRPDDVHMEKWW